MAFQYKRVNCNNAPVSNRLEQMKIKPDFCDKEILCQGAIACSIIGIKVASETQTKDPFLIRTGLDFRGSAVPLQRIQRRMSGIHGPISIISLYIFTVYLTRFE